MKKNFTILLSVLLFAAISQKAAAQFIEPDFYITNQMFITESSVEYQVQGAPNDADTILLVVRLFDAETTPATFLVADTLTVSGDQFFFTAEGGFINLNDCQNYLLEAAIYTQTGPCARDAYFTTYCTEITGVFLTEKISHFEMYPNPVNDLLTIESDQPMGTVQVHSINGQLIAEFPFSDDFQNQKLEISMKDFPEGNYIVTAEKLPIRKMISVIH